EAGETREPRPTLRHELDELRADLRAGIPRKPRDIAPRTRQAPDASLLDPAEPTQTSLPRLDEQLHVRLHHADSPDSLRRLRPNGERRSEEHGRTSKKHPPV